MSENDVLVFSVEGVRRLKATSVAAGFDLAADHAALAPWIDEATTLTGVDQTHILDQLSRIRIALDETTSDLTRRIALVESVLADAHRVDELAADLGTWNGIGNDPRLSRLAAELFDLVLALVGGDEKTAGAVVELVTAGLPTVDALNEVVGRSAKERAIIEDLRAHFGAFDNATGGSADGRVSTQDIEFVMANPGRFTAGQVTAAEAILSTPELWARLDTAADNADILAEDGFGTTSGGDGVTSLDDLQAYEVKARLNRVLGDYADRIDVAADAGGDVDGFISRSDLATFAATDDLPPEVRAAASEMLDAEMFDRSWLEDHRDELALGAAVAAGAVAGGVAIVATGGAAAPIVVMGAGAVSGATAGAGTTLAVNASGDAESLGDDVMDNGVRGGLLGSTAAGLPGGLGAVGSASTLPARAAAASKVLSDVAAITWAGGADIVIPEPLEDDVHDLADFVSKVTGPAAEHPG
jgi:hypothetical protein